jgi:DNA-directed RNA polymerase subunit H (RpoH/RPB5)
LNKEAIAYYGNELDNYVNKTLKPLLKDKPSEHKLNWCQYWNADLSKSIVVYYDTKGNTQVSNSTVKTFKNILDEAERLYARIRRTSLYEKNFEGILIVDAKLSPVANSEMSDIARGQVFLESELSFNPSLSIDNQKHTLVPKEDVKALLQSLRADKHGLETFKVYDPTIKYYGWKEGDLIKVIRTDYGVNVLSPDSINYKLVVA